MKTRVATDGTRSALLVCAAALGSLAGGGSALTAEWKPGKPVEIMGNAEARKHMTRDSEAVRIFLTELGLAR